MDRVGRQMLYPVLPSRPGATPRRALFVVEGLWELLNSPEGSLEWEQRIGALRATLERFVEGRVIDPKYLFLLYPTEDSVWEIRCTRESPSIRVLGLFAERDVFIATNYALREDLGGWQSRDWKRVKREAKAKWRTLFLTYSPEPGTSVQSVVTGALNGTYFRNPPNS
jgi:hypothetical protein